LISFAVIFLITPFPSPNEESSIKSQMGKQEN
jgi:hypothetical protein